MMELSSISYASVDDAAEWCRLSDRAFSCCRTSQVITLINVVYFSGSGEGVTAQCPEVIIV